MGHERCRLGSAAQHQPEGEAGLAGGRGGSRGLRQELPHLRLPRRDGQDLRLYQHQGNTSIFVVVLDEQSSI